MSTPSPADIPTKPYPTSSHRPRGARWWRLGIIAVAVAGLLISSLGAEFFTTQSNAIVIGYYAAAVAVGWRRGGRAVAPRLRGGATSWILITGIANQVVLAGGDPLGFLFTSDPGTLAPSVGDLMVHYIVPAMVLVDWIAWRPPRGAVRWRDAALWTAYPLLYLLAVTARGALFPQIEDRYPYPFLDPSVTGWPGPAAALPVVVILMVAIPFAIAAVERLRVLVVRSSR